MAQTKQFDINKIENFLKNSADKAQTLRKKQDRGVQPFMAELPKERMEERVSPFANTGVDYTWLSENHEEMTETLVLSLHMCCACCTQSGSRRMSCCYNEIRCTKKTEYHFQW